MALSVGVENEVEGRTTEQSWGHACAYRDTGVDAVPGTASQSLAQAV